jgi:4-amino-4-deoxy-L-arabinose transferase-like glycosyltransferase
MSIPRNLKQIKNNSEFGFWLITISIFIGLIVPVLIREGMFMDGQQYACVAKNLANGKGSFWFPYLSSTWWKAGSPYFMEHPPLVYGLQSIFFKIFNNSIYSERIYSFLTAIIHVTLISMIWKRIFHSQKHAWYAVLLFLFMPIVSWAFQNNIMENTMSVFTLAAVLFLLESLKHNQYSYLFSLLAGLFVFLAFLSKGIPGLFPLVAGIFYIITFKALLRKKIITSQLIFFVVPILLTLILFQFPTSAESLGFYLKERLLHRISGEPTVQNRLFILKSLGLELAVPLLIVILIKAIFKNRLKPSEKSYFLFFLLIGLSASLPLLLTSVQRGFYLFASLPFFAISFAILSKSSIEKFIQKTKHSGIIIFVGTMLLITSITFSVTSIGKYSRDKAMILDVKAIGEVIPSGSTICISKEVYDEWNLQMYLIRYHDISVGLECNNTSYLLTSKLNEQNVSDTFELLKIDLNKYKLYQQK